MKIKNWLLPHPKNNYHPYLLRPLGLLLVLLVVALQPLAYNATAAHRFKVLGYASDISASSLYDLTNQQRAAAGLPALSPNSLLVQAAENKAADMFADNYWAHTAPDGLTPWYFISSAGYTYVAAGENLAKDFSTSNGVMSAWMGSSEHRANILSGAYKDMGIAVENGNLLGSPTTLVVAMYGARSAPAPAPAPAVHSTPPPAATSSTSPPAETPPATETATVVPEATQTDKTTQTKPKTQTASKASASGDSIHPEVKGLSVFAKMADINSLNWGQQATIFLLSTLLLVNLLKHTLVWRAQKRGRRNVWLRAHPVAQMSLLVIAILFTAFASYGVVL
jgi:uncharacterized protein YkwD